MPYELTDELLQYMIQMGYLIVVDTQECSNKLTGETLFDFGQVPPESDEVCRELYFQLYQETKDWMLVDGQVIRKPHRSRSYRRRPRR